MRPGPGLVVMALAFISGARRGTGQQSSSASQSGKLGKVGEDNTGEGGALTRINPWLSACDLEQPNSAPDLQAPVERMKLFYKFINVNSAISKLGPITRQCM
uniref:Uncharacterized protein n=1 Tax=Anopheles culicifacies TaxID=139723 RepID=A0A182M263_9DIPT